MTKNIRTMTSLLLLMFLSIQVSLSASGRSSASMIEYKSGKETVRAYVAIPDGPGPFPAILLVHEWWGLNDWVKGNARNFADSGYIAMAIDLYRGKSTASADTAHEIMRGLPEDRAARDLQAAMEYLRSRKNVIPEKTGVIGWCMGGGYALVAAMNTPGIAGTVICYGRLVTDSASIAKINGPLLGIFGNDDNGISPESVREFEHACREAGKEIEIRLYDHAGHAFMNPNNVKGFSAESSRDAWTRISSFFRSRLKK